MTFTGSGCSKRKANLHLVLFGSEETASRSLQVCQQKVTHRRLEKTELAAIAQNYPSMSSKELERFREEESLGQSHPKKRSPFCVCADIRAAHTLVKVRKAEWGYKCCKADSQSETVWVNINGDVSFSIATCWWFKFAGLLGRFVGYMLYQRWFMHMITSKKFSLVKRSSSSCGFGC